MTVPSAHQAVLADAIQRAIGGRPVRAAVFTTFSFDPEFFEEHAVAALFGHAFSTESRVKLAQLEAALNDCGPVSVYYDAAALREGAVPPVLNVRRFDVRWGRGAFHSKVVLVLVEGARSSDRASARADVPLELVVVVSSANLTQEGWWENVEGGHVASIATKDVDGNPTTREGVLEIVRLLERLSEGTDGAIERIHEFLRKQASTDATKWKSYRTMYPRVYGGSSDFIDWMRDLKLGGGEWNLEIISPFLDESDPETLRALLDAVDPRACRIALPIERKTGFAAISRAYFDGVVELNSRFDVRWGDLPEDLTIHAKATKTTPATRRGVHAKVYRFWREKDGRSVVVVGSVNLTRSGTLGWKSGNVEAAFLVEESPAAARAGWWLDLLPQEPSQFAVLIEREDEVDERPIGVSIRYDWLQKSAEVRFDEALPQGISVASLQGEALFRAPGVDDATERSWTPLPPEAGLALDRHLRASSYVRVHDGARTSTVLVRECGWAGKPSVILTLTPEQILLYWSLLTPDQRAAFLEQRLLADGTLDGLGPLLAKRLDVETSTFFDRCAGLYHAFESLRGSIQRSLDAGRPHDAISRLYGEKYDSLPVLLDRVAERADADPVQAYLTYLCAGQLDEEFRKPLAAATKDGVDALDRGAVEAARQRLATDRIAVTLPRLEARLVDGTGVCTEFLDWLREAFVKRIASRPEGS